MPSDEQSACAGAVDEIVSSVLSWTLAETVSSGSQDQTGISLVLKSPNHPRNAHTPVPILLLPSPPVTQCR